MNEKSLTNIMLQLSQYNITGIQINYEGSGDSGCVERICFTQEPAILLEDLQNIFDDSWNSKFDLENFCSDPQKVTELKEVIDDIVSELLLDCIEDWYNNDGGFGSVYMLVPSGNYCIENNVRYMEVHAYHHEDNVFNKTKL